jgi:hypothetical protein
MMELLDLYWSEAYDYAKKFGISPDFAINLGKFDAFRHAYASAEMTREYGETLAHFSGNLYELYDDIFKHPRPGEKNMDLWNNAVGRSIGKNPQSSDDSAQQAYDALIQGNLITDAKTDTRKYGGEDIQGDDTGNDSSGAEPWEMPSEPFPPPDASGAY